jgi:predicted site-specific integrase-resolvase
MKQKLEPITVSSVQAARLLGVSLETLKRLRQAGRVKAKVLNENAKCKTYLYAYDELKQFAKQ